MKKIVWIFIFGIVTQFANGQGTQILKICEDNKYIGNQDNEPFFWLWGTAWELIHRLTKEEID
jgi:hypothetical protein